MNVRTNYPFNAALVRRFKYENAVFVVFLTGKPFSGTLIRLRHPQPSLFLHSTQPFRQSCHRLRSCLSAGKTQSALAQDALVRVGTQEGLYQYRKPRLLRLFPRRHLQRFVDLRQQRSPFVVGQKAGVTHHLKMPRGNVADIAPDHLFLAQRLAFMLPRAVIEVMVNHRATTIVPQAGGRHRRTLQVASSTGRTAPADNAATGAHRDGIRRREQRGY